jgi:hypothetical protein
MDLVAIPRAAMLVALLTAGLAQAACPLDEAAVSGVVVDARDGTPLAGASVEAAWDERSAGRMSVTRQSGADGGFALRILFDTYSGRTLAGRDVCEAQLESVDLAVELGGYAGVRATLPRESLAEPQRIELRPAP